MHRRVTFAIIVFGLLASRETFSAEPPKLSDLLKAVSTGGEAEKIKAINALEEYGNANGAVVEALLDRAKNDSPAVRAHALHALGVLKAEKAVEIAAQAMSDGDAEVRHAAIFALQQLKPDPKITVPLIDGAIRDSDPTVRMHVLNLIAEIGKPAVPTLLRASSDESLAPWCCIALGAIGPDAADAVPALTKMLSADHPPKLRLEAAMALASIGPASAPALPELTKILDGKDAVALPGAIYAIGKIGPPAKSAEKRLRELAGGADAFDRVIASWAILKIHPDNQKMLNDSLPLFVTALVDKEPRMRVAATKALLDLKPDPQTIMPAIGKAMDGASAAALENIVEIIGGAGASAVPNLVKALKEESLRPKVAVILARIGPEAKGAAPALAEIVENDKSPVARREALIALGAIGPFAAEQTPAIAKVLHGDDSQLRAAACYSLGKIGPLALSAKADLLECLKADDELCYMAAAWALARIDPNCPEGSKKSVPCLVKSLYHADPHVRFEAINSLQLFGSQAKEAVPALKKVAADDPQAAIRMAAIEAIKIVGR
jgi:HEAT repeat protein